MSRPLSVSSLKDLFRYPFRGVDWKNRFLVGSALVLAGFFIPIVPLIFVCGYTLQVTRRTLQGEEPSLPPWADWGRLGVDGLRGLLVSFVYLLPGTALYFIGLGVYTACILVVPFLTAASGRASEPAGAALALVGVGLFMLFTCAAMLLWLLGAVPLPVATAHFVARDSVAAAFYVREWWPLLRANKLGFFIDWVVLAGLSALLYLGYTLIAYTAVLCCLLPYLLAPALFYLALVGAAKFAESYREGAEMVGAGWASPGSEDSPRQA